MGRLKIRTNPVQLGWDKAGTKLGKNKTYLLYSRPTLKMSHKIRKGYPLITQFVGTYYTLRSQLFLSFSIWLIGNSFSHSINLKSCRIFSMTVTATRDLQSPMTSLHAGHSSFGFCADKLPWKTYTRLLFTLTYFLLITFGWRVYLKVAGRKILCYFDSCWSSQS